MSETETTSNAAKRLARLVAVQVLYQASFGEEKLADILKNALSDVRSVLNDDEGEDELVITGEPDQELLSYIVYGVDKNKETIEEMLLGALDSRFTFKRMEALLRMLMVAGAYELHHHADIDAPIIISDYVDIARSFFNAKEPGLVNAVLDRLAKVLRT